MPASIYSDNVRTQTPPAPEPPASLLNATNLAFLETLKKDYPNLVFKAGKKFLFRPKKTIHYLESNENFRLLLLHELAHALLGHFSFEKSLERLKIERDAWAKTKSLCKKYSVPFNEDFAEDELDTYRDWVHQKTLCPTCHQTCLEVTGESLFCPFCERTFKKS